MDDDSTSGRPNGGGFVVEHTIEVVPCGHVGSEGGLSEEVEIEFGLWVNFFLEVAGEGGVYTSKDG